MKQEVKNGKFRCLECGEWQILLLAHTYKKHGLNRKQYCEKHGLDPKTKLIVIEKRRHYSREYFLEEGKLYLDSGGEPKLRKMFDKSQSRNLYKYFDGGFEEFMEILLS